MVEIGSQKKNIQRVSLNYDTRLLAYTDPYTHPPKETYITLVILMYFLSGSDTAGHQHSQCTRRALRKETSIIKIRGLLSMLAEIRSYDYNPQNTPTLSSTSRPRKRPLHYHSSSIHLVHHQQLSNLVPTAWRQHRQDCGHFSQHQDLPLSSAAKLPLP